MVNEDENVNADEDDAESAPTGLPKGHLFGGPASPGFDGGPLNPADVDNPNTLSILLGYRWTTSFQGSEQAKTLSYAFPTMTSDYSPIPGGYPGTQYLDGFAPATAAQQAVAKIAMDLVSSYTDLKFVPAASPSGDAAAIRFANTTYTDAKGDTPSVGHFPYWGGLAAGDVFLNSNGNVQPQYFGTDPFLTVTHELGHALGLTHGDGDNNFPALQPQFTGNEFTVMTYASYLGSPANLLPTAAIDGSSPQSYMMFDIAALQFMYGANFSKVGSSATYSWDANGQEYINGQVAPDTGVTSTHKIFATVWTQGATTTYDLHNFSDNQVDDLRPGHWLTFSHSQLADLNSNAPAGTPQYEAQGNIYNALLYHGNTDSEITTLVTGSGNDKIIGNDLDDMLNAGAGNDTIMAGSGDDIMIGGPGADSIYFHFGNGSHSSGHDILRDTPADLNGDQVWGFGSGYTSALDVLGVQFGHSSLVISNDLQSATLTLPDATTKLDGTFTNGDFMIDTRGSGDQEHTTFSFVQFMPTLAEGKAVSASVLNGIGNQPFLTGDGSVDFTLTFNQAVSAYANTLGFYEVSADGTMHDVHILFSNTHAAAAGQTIDLGVPGNNERIGFFLIQDGFDKYGNLPNDLSFLGPSMQQAANLNSFGTPVLVSASHGALTAAQIFHSFDALNPGGAPQVLSGLPEGTHTLQIGFEDLPNGKGDNDFQDVVVSINASHGYLLG
jgi:Ca2+-binding RTX toxin-like protein